MNVQFYNRMWSTWSFTYRKSGLKFLAILILLLFALFASHSDPPSRGQVLENKTGSDCVDKKAMNSAFKA